MALFCPTCHNMLLVRNTITVEFHCRTCPYVLKVKEKISSKTFLEPKKVADPIGKEQQNRGAKTQAVCPQCNHSEAYFFQIQIRSGDEPMTSFFTCCKCEFRWREG